MTDSQLRAPIRHADALAVDRRITLDARQIAALRFRQINPKEAFTILDREGRCFRAALLEAGPDAAEAKVYEAMPTSTESPLEVALFCAVLGRQRMLTVIQKATELGATDIVPVITARSVQADRLAHEKAHAWPAQALRACRQCRRASVPSVSSAMALADALEDARARDADLRVHLDDRVETSRIAEAVPRRVAFFVGPEGGFTDEERAMLDARGFSGLRLGGRVLRAETAAIVGLAVVQHAYGDFR